MRAGLVVSVTLLLALSEHARACDPQWSPAFATAIQLPPTQPLTFVVRALAVWDPDNSGPLNSRLVVGGAFSGAGGIVSPNICAWDGTQWHALSAGLPTAPGTIVQALAVTDPDGDDPLPVTLFAGGIFAGANPQPFNSVARWNGAAWAPMGNAFEAGVHFSGGGVGHVDTMIGFDPDANGPAPNRLWVAGRFQYAGPFSTGATGSVALWNGTTWESNGSTNNGAVVGSDTSTVFCATTWDHDNNSSTAPALFLGGQFNASVTGGAMNGLVSRWNPASTTWTIVAANTNGGFVRAMTSFDPDADGPQPSVLIAAGDFTQINTVSAQRVARYNGTTWTSLGTGLPTTISINALTVWDPDADGPRAPLLIAGGETHARSPNASAVIYTWDGVQWTLIGEQTNVTTSTGGSLAALCAHDDQLFAAGGFNDINTIASKSIARFSVPYPVPGDANADHAVNGADLSVLLSQFGQSVTPNTGADYNGDGQVNGADLSVLLANFGTAC